MIEIRSKTRMVQEAATLWIILQTIWTRSGRYLITIAKVICSMVHNVEKLYFCSYHSVKKPKYINKRLQIPNTFFQEVGVQIAHWTQSCDAAQWHHVNTNTFKTTKSLQMLPGDPKTSQGSPNDLQRCPYTTYVYQASTFPKRHINILRDKLKPTLMVLL